MMISPKVKGAVMIALLLGIIFATYKVGQRSERRTVMFSDLMEKAQGRHVYLVDMEIICSNGKDIGRLQIDVNLANGRLVVVRNDSRLQPNCTK